MNETEEANLILDLAERYSMTTLEVVRMVRLVAYGPLGYKMFEETGIYEEGADEYFYALRIAKRIAQHPPISELLEIYNEAHEILVWQCEHEHDLAKRAAMFTKLHEAEKVMEANRKLARKELARRKREEIEGAN